MRSQENYTVVNFIFHVIELKKLEEVSEEEKKNELYRWARLIAAKNREAVCTEAKGNPYMEAALDGIDKINKSETERYLYLRREMAVSDEKSRLITAENKGKLEGESTFASLTEKLIKDSRMEDLLKATNDKEFRDTLYREYGIKR